MSESTVRIGLVLPDVMGTYGDNGNALILRQRLRRATATAMIPFRNRAKSTPWAEPRIQRNAWPPAT